MIKKDNIRIVKNTIIVYVRLVVTAIIGLITSRYVLQILGASDFGLYSVIGGVIVMFTFISGSLQATTVRFINYEMGKSDGNLNLVFNTSRQIHILFAVAIFILAEILGVYYILNYLNVDAAKIGDALFVFHVSMSVACLGIVNVPYQGLLIAHEKFSHVACVDIFISVAKLVMVIGLFYSNGNLLRLYALGMGGITFISFVVYLFFCWRYWPEVVAYKLSRSARRHKEMLIFNNYTLLTTVSLIGRNQGSNLLINFFFGTIVNAAYAISNTVHTYVNTFAGCFDQASAPQITQSLSRGDNERALFLVNNTCRICILLVEIVFFAMIADLDFILHLWLGDNVPDGTYTFCQLTLLLAVVSATSGGLAQYINGLGRIKWFTIIMSLLYLIAFVISLLSYKMGAPAESIILSFILADVINRGFQLHLLRRMVNFPVSTFLKKAYLRPAMVFLVGMLVVWCYRQMPIASTVSHLAGIAAVVVVMAVVVLFVGLSSEERNYMLLSIKHKQKNENY